MSVCTTENQWQLLDMMKISDPEGAGVLYVLGLYKEDT